MTVTLTGYIIPDSLFKKCKFISKTPTKEDIIRREKEIYKLSVRGAHDSSIIGDQEKLNEYCSELKYTDKNLNFNIMFCPENYYISNNFNIDDIRSYCKSNNIDYKYKINIIFYGNESGDYMPFTKWIIFHRTYHAFYFSVNDYFDNKLIQIFKKLTWDFFKHIDVEKYIYDITDEDPSFNNGKNIELDLFNNFMEGFLDLNSDSKKLHKYLNSGFDESFYDYHLDINKNLNKNLFTFKSARTERLITELDIGPEFFAQKIVQGRCILQNVDFIDEKYITEDNRNILRSIFKKHETSINNIIDELISCLNKKAMTDNTFYSM